jgi:hypothetical protein
MATKTSQFVLYKSFVDAFMKAHPDMSKHVNISFLIKYILFYFSRLVITMLKSNGIKLKLTIN